MCSINFYKDNTYRGKATFYSDGTELVPPKFDSNVGTVILAFNLSQFHAIVDMMREEKPIWVYYWNPRNAGIQTGLEPTGEEE